MCVYKNINLCICVREKEMASAFVNLILGHGLSLYRQVINADKMSDSMNMYTNTFMKYL